jgi:arginyl-tRNA synthetase
MGHGVSTRMHINDWGELAFIFLQNYTVKLHENDNSNSQGHSEHESNERMSKPMKEHFL